MASDLPPGPQPAALKTLPSAEQRSLWMALSAARHAVDALTGHEKALPQNQGAAFFAHNPGQRLTARFLTDGGVRLGSGGGGGGWQATLRLAGGGRAPVVTAAGNRVEARHAGGLTEWFERNAAGHPSIAPAPMRKVPADMISGTSPVFRRRFPALHPRSARSVEAGGGAPETGIAGPTGSGAHLNPRRIRTAAHRPAGPRRLPRTPSPLIKTPAVIKSRAFFLAS